MKEKRGHDFLPQERKSRAFGILLCAIWLTTASRRAVWRSHNPLETIHHDVHYRRVLVWRGLFWGSYGVNGCSILSIDSIRFWIVVLCQTRWGVLCQKKRMIKVRSILVQRYCLSWVTKFDHVGEIWIPSQSMGSWYQFDCHLLQPVALSLGPLANMAKNISRIKFPGRGINPGID